ncbi:FecCD family ABC transporter permease [Pilimelia columellifera]|uniref:FecCD family ABC transporter permease n=1 Tax=Pilimelia columellifera TaxID=706574 RepID=UPI003CD0AD00
MRLFGERISFRIRWRPLVVGLLLLVLCLAALVLAASVGDYRVPLGDAARAIVGEGSPMAELFVTRRRLPRALTALAVGAALGVAGAIFQTLTRNPLGSPDIIGFGQGAAAGAVTVLLVLGGGTAEATVGAFLGGLTTAAVVYLLALRGGAQGYLLVLVGIGVSAMLVAYNNFLVSRAELSDAKLATMWVVGSLYERRWPEAALMGAALAVLLPAALALQRTLSMLEVGDELAGGLGVRVSRVRLAALGVAVALTAVATACAGPVAFVALVAPQVARRLTRSTGPGMLPAAAMGGLLLLVGDVVAQRLTAPVELPVGVVTGAIGGVYLAWLLLREWRSGRG